MVYVGTHSTPRLLSSNVLHFSFTGFLALFVLDSRFYRGVAPEVVKHLLPNLAILIEVMDHLEVLVLFYWLPPYPRHAAVPFLVNR